MGSKERRDKERTRRIAQIQKAARAVFLKKGFQNATMDEIADRANVSKGAVYFYFKNKDELYVSLMIPHIEKLRGLLEDLEKKLAKETIGPDFDLIDEIFRIYKETYDYDAEGVRIYQIFQLNNLFPLMSQATKDKLVTLGQGNFRIVRQAISTCIERGLIRRIDPMPLADFLWGSFLGIIQLDKSKHALNGKEHLPGTLKCGSSIVSRGCRPETHCS
jgi:AcrR family transcriptional regulator